MKKLKQHGVLSLSLQRCFPSLHDLSSQEQSADLRENRKVCHWQTYRHLPGIYGDQQRICWSLLARSHFLRQPSCFVTSSFEPGVACNVGVSRGIQRKPRGDFRLSTFDFRLPTSDFRLPTSDFRLPTSDFRLPTSDFRLPTSDFRLPTSDFRLPTSDFRLPTSDFRLLTSDFHLQNLKHRSSACNLFPRKWSQSEAYKLLFLRIVA